MNFLNFIRKSKPSVSPPPKTKSYSAGGWINILGSKNDTESFSTTWVSTAVNIRNENLASGNIFMYRQNGKTTTEVTEHPFLNIINTKNVLGQTFYKIMYLIGSSLDVYGKAFLYVAPNLKGSPANFILLPTPNVQVVLNKEKTLIERYEIKFSNGSKQIYKKEEVIFFSLPSLNNTYGGTATIESCKHIINIDNYRQILQEKFLLTGGNINIILEADGELSPEAVERLNETMRERQNISNTDAFLVLQDGLKSKDTKLTAKELDFAKSSDAIRDEILGKLRVPLLLTGKGETTNRATAQAVMFSFIKNVIKPFSRFIVDEFNSFIKTTYGKEYFITIEWEDFKDISEQIQLYDMLYKNSAISKGELRSAFGFSNEIPLS